MKVLIAVALLALSHAPSRGASTSQELGPFSLAGNASLAAKASPSAPAPSPHGVPPELSDVNIGKAVVASPNAAEPAGELTGGGDTFATATVIPSLPYVDGGTTVGFGNDYTAPCAQFGPPDVVYRYTPETNTCVTISLCGSGFDTALHLYKDSEAGFVACNDDYCGGSPQQSKLQSVALEAGHVYYIVVDGFGCDFFGCSQGSYALSVTTDCPAPCVVECPPDAIQEGEGDFCLTNGTNDGCNMLVPAFTDIPCSPGGVTVCGTYGSSPDAQRRDTDWYRLVVTESSHITFCGVGEATTVMNILDLSGGCGSIVALASGATEPCQELCLEATVNPGIYVLVVASIFATDIPCGKKYKFTATCEPAPFVSLHCNDANGNSLNVGQGVTTTGIVTSNFPTGGNSRFTIQDGASGITVFGVAPYCGSLGDLVRVQGTLIQFSGLLEMSNPLTITLLSSGNPQPAPVALTPAEVNASFQPDFCEPNESRLVKVEKVTIVSSSGMPLPPGSTFGANTYYGLLAEDLSLTSLRIVQTAPNICSLLNPLVGLPIPSGPVNVTGVLSQFDNISPFTSGYQVQPRQAGDIVTWEPVAVGTGPSLDFAISPPYPNPGRGAVTFGLDLPRAGRVEAGVFDLGGRQVAEIVSAWFAEGRHTLTWDGLTSARVPASSGMYFVRVSAAGRKLGQRFVIVR